MISYIFLGYIFFLSIITPNKQHIIYNQSALNTWLEKVYHVISEYVVVYVPRNMANVWC